MDEIKDRGELGGTIIVEGKRDERSLLELGIKGDIALATHFPLLSFAENVSEKGKEVVILTDWDKKGEELARRLSVYLRSMDAYPNDRLRRKLGLLVKKEIKSVEELSKYVKKLRSL